MLSSPGLLLNSNLFVLTNIVNYTLFVSAPRTAEECYITMDFNNTLNDTWPSNWKRMNWYKNNITGEMCFINLNTAEPSEMLNYKVRYYYTDGYTGGTEKWQTILWKFNETEENNNSCSFKISQHTNFKNDLMHKTFKLLDLLDEKNNTFNKEMSKIVFDLIEILDEVNNNVTNGTTTTIPSISYFLAIIILIIGGVEK